MRFLLRSCFIGGPADDSELAYRNYIALRESGLGFDVPEDTTLWGFVRDFAQTHNHCPEVRTVRLHFEQLKKPEVGDRLEVLAPLKPLFKGDFLKRLEERAEERRSRMVVDILREASQILQTGIEVKEGKNTKHLRGPMDAVHYLVNKSHDIVMPTTGQRLSGEVTGDGEDFKREYEKVESDPLAGIGQFTGLEQMDTALGGAKKHELWTHAAFTSQMKSTLLLNWMYNQAVYYKYDSMFFSLEMPYAQCRRILYAMHSLHGKFREDRIRLGIQKNPGPNVGLEYAKIRDGKLSQTEKSFLMDYVRDDFNSGLYGKIHIEVSDPDKSDFNVADLRAKAELIYSKSPYNLLGVDHTGLLSPRKWVPSTTERLNEVIRDLKRLAMNFNRGAGMAVVNLFQLSREGFKAAEKAAEKSQGTYTTGPYNLTHLSYANECFNGFTYLRRGIVHIRDVMVGDDVWSSTGWKSVLNTFDQGMRPIWEVVTDRGSKLAATNNHRVRVLRDEKITWCPVQDLMAGDYVLSSAAPQEWPVTPPVLPPLNIGKYEKPNGEQGISITTPGVITEDLAYLLGAWDGDGAIHKGGIGFTGNVLETATRNRIQDTFQRVFNHTLRLAKWHPSRPGSFDMLKRSAPLKRWFEGVAGKRGKEVPAILLQSPRGVILAYLRGLFDTDGYINSQFVIGVHMKCESFLRRVQILLTALGYDSHLGVIHTTLKVTGKTYEGWNLRLRGRKSAEMFSREIGFTELRKHDRVRAALEGVEKNKTMYPLPETFLRAYGLVQPVWGSAKPGFHNAPRKARLKRLVSHGDIWTLLGLASVRQITSPDLDFLQFVSGLQVMRVMSVAPTGREEPVYDIEVGGDHEYQSGPLLSHNCERSSDVVTAGYIDDNLRSQNRLLLQCLKSRDNAPFPNFFSRVEWHCRRILTSQEVPMMNRPGSDGKMADALGEIEGLL